MSTPNDHKATAENVRHCAGCGGPLREGITRSPFLQGPPGIALLVCDTEECPGSLREYVYPPASTPEEGSR